MNEDAKGTRGPVASISASAVEECQGTYSRTLPSEADTWHLQGPIPVARLESLNPGAKSRSAARFVRRAAPTVSEQHCGISIASITVFYRSPRSRRFHQPAKTEPTSPLCTHRPPWGNQANDKQNSRTPQSSPCCLTHSIFCAGYLTWDKTRKPMERE